ncbi:MAG TPA: DNA polymerase IV [Caulobacterales bacterium]|nr:DNA polymerase IV [Caulobacterales bacterium]
MQSLCRSCAGLHEGALAVCPQCGGTRLVQHAELSALTIAHLDCDAFYATIEKRDDPSLAAKPVIVGGGKRGVVSTCCYVARAFGVRSAMPMFRALELCPHAVVIKPRMSLYVKEGRRVLAMMQALTPLVQPLSIDEAFMDLSGLEKLHGRAPAQTLARLQNEIEAEIGITVSIGLAFNKLLAKMASDLEKPRGFSAVGRADALDFLADKPVGALFGVGPAAVRALNAAGLKTIGDIRAAGPEAMRRKFADWGEALYALSIARDNRRVDPDGERKSISSETTFFDDISEPGELEDILWDLCERVAERARAAESAGRTITLKLKDKAFKSITRRRTLEAPTRLAHTLFEHGRALLRAEANGRTKFRLIGIGLSDLRPAEEADRGDLMDSETPKRAAAEDAIAKAREKFGRGAVRTGRAVRAGDEDG